MNSFQKTPPRFRKGEIASSIAEIRKAPLSPALKQVHLALLNSKLDLALGRITLEEFNLSVQQPDRAVIRLQQQSAAFAQGNLTL